MDDSSIQPDKTPQLFQVGMNLPPDEVNTKSKRTADRIDIDEFDRIHVTSISNQQIEDEARKIIQNERLDLFQSFANYDLRRIDYFSPKTQQRIRQDVNSINTVINEISIARAKFNLTEDLSAFNKYLPYRKSIRNNSEKLKQYDEMVKLIVSRTDMRLVESDKLRAFDGFPKADLSTAYMFAALVAEVYHNKPKLVKKVLDREKHDGMNFKVKFSLDTEPFGLGTADYNNMITIRIPKMWYIIGFNPCRTNIPAHEFTHCMEAHLVGRYSDQCYSNGIIEEMEQMQDSHGRNLLARFTLIRDRLYELSEYRQLTPHNRDMKIMTNKEDSSTGFTSYIYSDEKEFLAENISMFYNEPERFFTDSGNSEINDLKSELYNILKQFFQFDPLREL